MVNFWKCLEEELSFMTSLTFTRHSPYGQYSVSGNATLKMAASWLTGKELGVAEPHSGDICKQLTIDGILCGKKGTEGGKAKSKNLQHIHLEILPRNHDTSIHWALCFFAFDENGPDTYIFMRRETLKWLNKGSIIVSVWQHVSFWQQHIIY